MTTAVATEPARNSRTPAWRVRALPMLTVPHGALSLEDVAARTGLKSRTITTAMYSTAHTGSRSLLRQISRPRYDVQGTPYWSADQVKDYFDQIEARFNVRKEFGHLETVDRVGAANMQAASLHGLGRLSTVPVGTLHRWKLAEGFPPPVAIMEVDSPTPRLLYSWPAFREYIKRYHPRWLARHPDVNIDNPRRVVTRFMQ
jgi:hypothetical protein